MKPEELKNVAVVLRELGLSYEETLEVMRGVAKDLHSVGHLWRKGDKARLIRIGLALIAFPEPTPISETLGAFVLSLGIIQAKMGRSTLHMEDVYDTFQGIIRDLKTIKHQLV